MRTTELTKSGRRRRLVGLLAACCCLTAAGCGDGLARVSGTVRLDGEPFEVSGDKRGMVTFQQTGGGPVGTGQVDDRGRYRIVVGTTKGLPPGEYRIGVKCSQVTYNDNPNIPPRQRLLTEPQYAQAERSGLVATLEPGSNTVDLEVVSTAAADD